MKKVTLFLSFFFSSFLMFAQDAPELVCPTPYIGALPINATSMSILWNSTAAASYTLQYRVCTDTAWTSVNNLTAGVSSRDTGRYILQNLGSCKCYVVRIRANCSTTEVSDWRSFEFRTSGCVEPCRAPAQLFAATRDTMASLNWSAMGATSGYVVQWKSRADTAWHTVTSATNTLAINRLQPCSEYQFRVKTVCSATLSSDYSETIKFKTSGCVAPCSTPREIRAVAAADRSVATVSWTNTGARAYEVTYTAGDSAARIVTVTTNILILSNVASCKTYKFQVRSICGSITAPVYSEWSSTTSVNTEGCVRCESPRRLSYAVTELGAIVKWDTIASTSVTYDIQYMGPRDTTWRTVSAVRGSQYTMTGLTACTWYMFRVKANCSTISSSQWSQPVRFQTKGCVPPCVAPKNLKTHIVDTVGVISWVGTSTGSYKLIITSTDNTFTREVTVTGNIYTLTGLLRCKTYKVQLKVLCSATSISDIITESFETKGCPVPCGTPREVNFQADLNKVTLKWSNMGSTKYYIEYKVAADSVTTWKRDSATTNTIVLTGLQSCKTYLFRIASVCTNGITTFSEPYKFITTGCPAPCIATTGLSSEIVNDTVIVVKFNFMPAQSYTVQYRLAGAANWTSIAVNTITATSLPIRITGLLKCSSYQWRVLRNCNATTLGESDIQTVRTNGCPTPCSAAPRDVLVTNYAADSAKLTWIMPTASLTYQVRYALAGSDTAIAHATVTQHTANGVVLRGLLLCRYYVAQVRTLCPNGLFSDWVTSAKFRVGANCMSIEPASPDNLNEKQQFIGEFGLYPNPGSESLQVSYKLEQDANVQIELINLQGKVVNRINGGNQETGNYVQTLDNVAALNTGFYLVVIRANGKVAHTEKWQKQ
jgi:trimeric autotransporter adhesin